MRRINASFTDHARYNFTKEAIPLTPSDPDAEAFVEFYSIIDNAEIAALDTLVARLKVGGINKTDVWTTAIGVYPVTTKDIVSAFGNIRNLVKPLISKGFDPTHSVTGLDFDGSQYLGTGFIMDNDMISYSWTMSQYQAVNNQALSHNIFGAYDGSAFVQLHPSDGGASNLVFVYSNAGGYQYKKPTTNALGLQTMVVRRVGSDNTQNWYIGAQAIGEQYTTGRGTFGQPTNELYYNARHNQVGGADNINVNESRFGYLGGELSLDQIQDLDFAVTEYQTTLGRQI